MRFSGSLAKNVEHDFVQGRQRPDVDLLLVRLSLVVLDGRHLLLGRAPHVRPLDVAQGLSRADEKLQQN